MDKKSIEKQLKEMDLFVNLKVVIAEYKVKVSKLLEREEKLNTQLEDLQENHTKLYMEIQTTVDVSEVIYLQKQSKAVLNEIAVIQSLLERTDEERTELKIAYLKPYLDAIQKDRAANIGKYNVNELIDHYVYELVSLIATLGNAMQSQYREVSSDVAEIIRDKKVMESYGRSLDYAFNSNQYTPTFDGSKPTVLSNNHLATAKTGQIPVDIRKPIEKGGKK